MVEVLHAYHGFYPFGHPKQSENTFMQLIKQNLSEEEVSLYRQMTKIYKAIACPSLMRLVKMLKEDSKLYFIYHYEELSLETYIHELGRSNEGQFPKQKYRWLIIQYKNNIDTVFDALIKSEIKTDVFMSNISCNPPTESKEGLNLKVFIDMDAEYLSLIEHNYRPKDSKKKDRVGLHQQFLTQFYQTERKRLMIDFQELLENVFGKANDAADKKQFHNFVIQGTKLLFTQPEEGHNLTQDMTHNSSREITSKNSIEVEKRPEEANGQVEELARRRSHHGKNTSGSKTNSPAPIVDFDQSFDPEFKPEEFLKDTTYIEEESDYLKELEDDLTKMALKKKADEERKQERSEEKIKQMSMRKEEHLVDNVVELCDKRELKPKDLTISQGSTQSNPNNQSNNDSYDKCLNEGQLNKYKMKIITSHQIEIEGGCEPNVEDIEKEIIEGIRTGKININDLVNNHQKFTVMTKDQRQLCQKGEEQPSGIGLYNSDHKRGGKEEMVAFEKMSSSENLKCESVEESRTNSVKTKEIALNKLKAVNEIISKLRLKSQLTNQNCKDSVVADPNQKCGSKSPSHQKGEKIQTTEGEQGENSIQKSEKAENYLAKIKEAKSKAEHLLREYTKKKQ